MPATNVKISLGARDPRVMGILCTTFRKVEVGTGANKQVKFRMVDTDSALGGTVTLKHPGKGGFVSVIGVNGNTKVIFSSLRRVKKA